MTDRPNNLPATAAERWAEQSLGWGLPTEILDQAPESPWFHDARRFAVDESIDRSSTPARWAREVLPPSGGTVLDVGCGGGRSSLPLVPPANELIGVDTQSDMLESFARAAAEADVARRTVLGPWPDVADEAPNADVVVCHHVAYNVSDIVPFVLALTAHARLAVVMVLQTHHPMSAWRGAWDHFWGLERPDGPTSDDLVSVLREVGLDPEVSIDEHRTRPSDDGDGTRFVAMARRRLCLPADRDAEVAAWFDEHPLRFVDRVATLRWPGAAEPVT